MQEGPQKCGPFLFMDARSVFGPTVSSPDSMSRHLVPSFSAQADNPWIRITNLNPRPRLWLLGTALQQPDAAAENLTQHSVSVDHDGSTSSQLRSAGEAMTLEGIQCNQLSGRLSCCWSWPRWPAAAASIGLAMAATGSGTRRQDRRRSMPTASRTGRPPAASFTRSVGTPQHTGLYRSARRSG